MRVIAGKAGSLPLRTMTGLNTRPTTDRIKETLFNMIADQVPGSRFLDLFSGSGGIGIEALSRGAAAAVFVENNRQALRCIHENLNFTRLAPQGRVLAGDVIQTVQDMNGEKPFTIIFMDPPYAMAKEAASKVSTLIDEFGLLNEGGIFIVESDADAEIKEIVTNMTCLKSCKYGATLVTFFLESETMCE